RRFNASRAREMSLLITLLATFSLLVPTSGWAQATVSTGNIQGTVTDPSGAAVSGAKVIITNVGTAATKELTTNSSGFYNSGSLVPGTYKIRVEARGFQASETQVPAQVGNSTGANIKLSLGSENQTVNVEAETVVVN